MSSESNSKIIEQESLRDKITNLEAIVTALRLDIELKDSHITNIAKDKEQLNGEVLKLKRTNKALLHQLEEERTFYYREKEIYCQEMNEYKRIKKKMVPNDSTPGSQPTLHDYRVELRKLKTTLDETLIANHNLGVKYLRMKNTKQCLKTNLDKLQTIHEDVVTEFDKKILELKAQIHEISNRKFTTRTVSPSNKKFLELVNKNSCLLYENLKLRKQSENLQIHLDQVQILQARNETNSRLKYLKPNSQNYCHLHQKATNRSNKWDLDGSAELLEATRIAEHQSNQFITLYERPSSEFDADSSKNGLKVSSSADVMLEMKDDRPAEIDFTELPVGKMKSHSLTEFTFDKGK